MSSGNEESIVTTCSFARTKSGGLQIYIGDVYGDASKILEGLPESSVAKTRYKAVYRIGLKKLEIMEQ